ncbi:MAG: hypothetical protein NTV02_03740 [Candidatus Zambryskibacteria bacterium]|nr:hypothetical protein [Candidatus Zambryskibacteria bacterium]
MLDFQQKWKTKTFMYSRGVRIFLAVLALYSLFSVYRVYEKKQESEGDLRKVEQQTIVLSAKDTALVKSIDTLQTDEGLEAEIRSKYSVAKEQEQVVVLVEDQEKALSTSTPKKSVWQKMRSFFGF